uniref:Putative exonuclease V, mitochondrial n=1 Tax=Talaromyces marneffei PM1 TaxID=1077442 RepID=A0A093VDY6_TALMA
MYRSAKQTDRQPNDFEDDDSSDYGSEFTPDEEELLNELLARVVAPERQISTTTTAAEETTTTSESQQQELAKLLLDDLQPLSDPLIVSDIEDYEVPHSARVPRVLGREAWSPATKRVWQQRQQTSGTARRLWSSQPPVSSAAVDIRAQIGEREGSPEGRPRDRERQRDREKEWTNAEGKTEAKSEPQTETALNNGNEDVTAATSAEEKSPIERFRKPPNKAFSVSDLISPAWCELQYWYTLTKHGRKRRTPAMMQGTAVHKVLEDEVHTTVPVDITTKEDGWALRIWNVIQGLRTLRTYGLTRELEVWGLVEGEIVTGIIDQLSYICPDPNLEASAAQHYADAEAARAALPEYQMSISDYFMSSGAGKPLDEMWKEPEEPAKEVDDDYGTDLDRSHQNSGESLRAYGQEYRISANASAVAAILPHA